MPEIGGRRRAGARAGVRHLRQRRPRLRRLDRPAHPAAGDGARGGWRDRAGRRAVGELRGRRSRDVRLDGVVRRTATSAGAGRSTCATTGTVLGVSCGDYRRHGAFAEYVAVPARILYQLPDALPFEHAALIEAVSVAVHAVQPPTCRRRTTHVVVVGCGMIGLLVVQVLRAKGCRTIIAVDVDDHRKLDAGDERLGATQTVDATQPTCPRRFASSPADAAPTSPFEVVGPRRDAARRRFAAVRKGGAVTLVGNLSPRVELPLQEVVSREIDAARLVRVERRVSRVHRPAGERRHRRRPLISADRAARRRAGTGSSGCTAATRHLMKVILQP